MSKITNDIKNVNLSTEFMPGMTTDSERTSFGSVICRKKRNTQGATDKLFFLSADTDKGRYTQFSYRPIPITYRYTIFHIGRYRNRYRYRISSNISYRNAIKIFFTIKCNLELLH